MNDVLASVVESLGRTTLCLAAVGAVVAVTLRLTRTNWPAAHRLGWVVTLLVGWTFLRLPVAVPWYEPPAAEPVATPARTPEVESVESPLLAPHFDPFAEPAAEPFAELPSSQSDDVIEIGPAAQAHWPSQSNRAKPPASEPSEIVNTPVDPLPPATEPAAVASEGPLTDPAAVQLSDLPPIVPPAAPPVNDWPRIVLAAWLTGMVVILAASAIGYLGFVRRLVPRPCREIWQDEWSNLVLAAGVRRAIPLRVTAGQGPMLCRLPRGMELVVPERLWRDLSPAARRAILRHELAHYLRGDVWKSLAARVLALPHWFNPVAWLAVRRFEEAAEWACDAAAADDSATDYARVLLQLGEAAPQPAYASSAGGRTLAARIRRVLAGPARPDSRLKKTAIVTVALLLVGASLVQLDLVAKQPSERQVAAADADADPFADAPPADDFDPAAAPSADAPSAESPLEQPPLADAPSDDGQAAEPPLADAPSDKSSPPSDAAPPAAAADATAGPLLAEADKIYQWAIDDFLAHKTSIEPIYEWSRRWMEVAERAAGDRAGRISAAEAHVNRMRELRGRVEKLRELQSKGGEGPQYFASKFYVAEAERHLAEVKAAKTADGKRRSVPGPNAVGELDLAAKAIDAPILAEVKKAYQDAQGKFESGKLSLDALFEWSERYRQAAVRTATDQAGKVQAAQDHLERMKEAFRRIDAAFQVGSSDGRDDRLNAAKVFVAEAQRQLAEVKGDDVLKAIRQGEAESRRMTPEKAELIYRLKQDVQHYETQALAQELSANRPNVDEFDAALLNRRHQEFEKLRDQAQKRLNEALRDQPQPDSLLASTDPAQQKLRSEIEVVDLEVKIAELTGQLKTEEARLSQLSQANSKAPGTVAKVELNTADIKIETLHRQLTLLNKKLALTKDLADREKQSTQSPQPKPTTGAGKTLRYGGRTFDEWVAELKDDLSPEHRAEAVKAMSLFATRGHAQAAGEAVLEAMREVNSFHGIDQATEQMKGVAHETFRKLPKDVSDKLIDQALKSDNANQRMFVLYHVLWLPESDQLRVLTKLLGDPDAEVRVAATMHLVPLAPETPGLLDAIRGLCKSEDPQIKTFAGSPVRALLNLLDKDGPKKDAAEKILTALGPDAKDALQAIATPGDNRLLARIGVDHTRQQARRILNRLEGKPDEPEATLVPPTTVPPLPPQGQLGPAEVPDRPSLNLTPKADPASKLRYDGKQFSAWAETLRDDLSPASRTEAIEALAMFGRFGLAAEAAQDILAAMRNYSVWMIDNSAEGKLKEAALKAFRGLPEKVTAPLLTTALASDSGSQRLFAATILSTQVRDSQEREKLFAPLLDDSDVEVRRLAATSLQSQADKYLAVVEIMREAVASPDQNIANWAVQVIGLKNPQPFVPILPTLVERLDTEEQFLLQQLQMALMRFGPLAIPALEAGEQSENRRVRAMSQQILQQIRSAAPPVAGEDSKQKPGTEPAPEASYRNKPLRSWLSILRRDLSPESRQEAIAALAVFGAHGHSREVAEAILDMMGDYSIFDMSASPDAPLKVAALDAFGKLDRGEAIPLVTEALKSENTNRRMFAAVILDQWVPKDNSLDLDELLADSDPAARLVFAGIVVHRDVANAKALEILRAGLESSDEKMRASAFGATMYLISQFNPGQGVEGPVLEALKKLGPAVQPIMENAAKSNAPNQAEVQAALRLLSFEEGDAKK